jgi:hypothetical protein
MKTFLTVIAALVIFAFCASAVQAQIPHVKIYFVTPDLPGDPYYWQETGCKAPGTLDTLVVVARNFGWIQGIEYCIEYPSCIFWIADFGTPVTTIGFTPCYHPSGQGGISSAFQLPLNSNAVVPPGVPKPMVAKVLIQWGTCPPDTPICVRPHQLFGGPRATRWPDNVLIYGIGNCGMICPDAVPTEDTTWGQIKAMYNE